MTKSQAFQIIVDWIDFGQTGAEAVTMRMKSLLIVRVSKYFVCPAAIVLLWFQGRADAQVGAIPGFSTETPYLIYYGDWDSAKVATARDQYAMVVLHPGSNVTAADVAAIQAGPDQARATEDDVLVLGYVSVGEDDRVAAPILGDGIGPRVDPRASSDVPLSEVVAGKMLGDPSPGGTGFASYYLDRDKDGQPDTNSTFGAPFVNAGDPAWFDALKNMEISTSGMAGLDEVLATTGKGLGCDGAFLDTVDTAAPDNFGGYEWTAPGMQALIKRIHETYPDKVLMPNRGIFYFNPNLKTYAYSPRPYIRMLLFESYYTDISDDHEVSPFFDDNKYNFAPKLNAEAGRPDGFTIFALGYDQPTNLSPATVERDYEESMEVQGWPLYRTNIALDTPFSTAAAAWVADNPDTAAPEWDSTAASGNQPASPRVSFKNWRQGMDLPSPCAGMLRGIRPGRSPIMSTTPMSLNSTSRLLPDLESRNGCTCELPCRGRGRPLSFEFTVTGLDNGREYLFAVRARMALPS
ncbi:MAG: hypothetical protein R3F19_15735 [Verrucomicrobiales bacterium]